MMRKLWLKLKNKKSWAQLETELQKRVKTLCEHESPEAAEDGMNLEGIPFWDRIKYLTWMWTLSPALNLCLRPAIH